MKKLRCILLIDDDEPTNFWNHFLLTKQNCAEHVVIAKSGREALDYHRHCMEAPVQSELYHWPDLIFLDINMPRMNGWEFLEKYISLPWEGHRKALVVFLTTSLFPEDLAMAEAMPEVAGLENKPLTPATLENIWKLHFPEYP